MTAYVIGALAVAGLLAAPAVVLADRPGVRLTRRGEVVVSLMLLAAIILAAATAGAVETL